MVLLNQRMYQYINVFHPLSELKLREKCYILG